MPHLSLEGHRFLIFFSLYEKSGDDPGSAVPKGTSLRFNALLGMNLPLPSGVCPLCVFSTKLCPIKGKNND